MFSTIKNLILKFQGKKDNSPNIKMSQKDLGDNNKQSVVFGDVNIGDQYSWKKKYDAATKTRNAFEGFLFENVNSLGTNGPEKQRRSTLTIYKSALKKHVNEALTVLGDNEQKNLQGILEDVLSKNIEEILQSRTNIFNDIEKSLGLYLKC